MKRLIVEIDRDRCIGCGKCVDACLTNALRVIDGKAVLVDEGLCDGFGSCIVVCPQHAIYLQYREAKEFDSSILASIGYDRLMAKLRTTSSL
jgi:MinD superfamily P-loop ATPase